MPYPNEHSCRIRQPEEFEAGSFRRIKQKKLSMIIGRLKGKTTTTTQAYRYPTDSYTEVEAKAHCKEQGGTFEPAAKKTQELKGLKDFDYLDPKENPMIRVEED